MSPGVAWCRPVSPGVAWCRLVLPGVAWCRLVSLGVAVVAWCRLVSLGVAWCCLVLPGVGGLRVWCGPVLVARWSSAVVQWCRAVVRRCSGAVAQWCSAGGGERGMGLGLGYRSVVTRRGRSGSTRQGGGSWLHMSPDLGKTTLRRKRMSREDQAGVDVVHRSPARP